MEQIYEMLLIIYTISIGSVLKFPTVDWDPTQRAGIQLVRLMKDSLSSSIMVTLTVSFGQIFTRIKSDVFTMRA